MMRKSVFLAVGILFLILACKKNEVKAAALTQEEISGSRLWKRISEESDYKTYAQWPGHEGKKPGQSPHGVEHQIYINSPLLSALPVDQAPEGSIIVKENYNASDEMVKVTAMVKVAGYDPEHNDWFWAAFSPDGTATAEGSPEGCISCHSGMQSNDYVIVHPLDEKL